MISKERIKEKIEEYNHKFLEIHRQDFMINDLIRKELNIEGALEVLNELLEECDGE